MNSAAMEASPQEISAESLTHYLRRRSADAVVVTLKKIGGGASRETFLAELHAPVDGLPKLLVIRKDTSAGGTVPTTLDREYHVLRALSARHIPVPRPLWYEEDPLVFGAPFYIRQGYQGTSNQKRFSKDAAARLSRELAGALAALHRLNPATLDVPGWTAPESIDEALRLDLARWSDWWQQNAIEPMPFMNEIAWWLRRNQPKNAGKPAVLWGDVGVANTICSPDGHLLAMSDFELACFGDPMRDLATALWRGVGQLAGKDVFLDAYVAAGGRDLDEQRLAYYDVFWNWQVAMFAHAAIAGTTSGSGRSLHPSLLTIWAQRVNLHKAGRRIGL